MTGGIVVGTDGSPTAMAAVDEAARLALARNTQVHLVSAYTEPAAGLVPEARVYADAAGAARQALEEGCERLKAYGVSYETYAVPAPAADALVGVAETHDAAVIVVGSRGMRGARRLLGSVPNSVTHSAPCSVYVVRTD